MCCAVPSCCSHVQLFATSWTIARQALLSKGFSRQEYRLVAVPFSGGLPNAGSKLSSDLLLWQVGSLPLALPGKPHRASNTDYVSQ